MTGALAAAFVMLAAHVRAEQVDQVVTVVKVSGGARYSTDNMKNWRTMKKGDVLKPGTMIQTADDGNVDVTLADKGNQLQAAPMNGTASANPTAPSAVYKADQSPKANVVHIFPSTVLVVDKLTMERTSMDEVSETQLDLRAGQIMGTVKKLSGGSRYEVKIPNGVAGIRGTTYVIRADGRVYVLSGSVVISYVDSTGTLRTAVVTAGNYFTPETGISPITGNPNFPPILQLTGPTTVTVHGRFPIIEHISPN
ncbi:MAG TPA: FecR domain-containing protein [Verrucomicrobiae bacterium]|nr:FecR domain-containing protein [Verrucomicrobiae bacterium]